MKRNDSYQKIWAVVRQIPFGKVATYGQIARLAGFGGQPRLAGYALHNTPNDVEIPWHRVINAQGRISLPKEDGRYDLQKTLLEAEDVVFIGERVDLERFRWHPDQHVR